MEHEGELSPLTLKIKNGPSESSLAQILYSVKSFLDACKEKANFVAFSVSIIVVTGS